MCASLNEPRSEEPGRAGRRSAGAANGMETIIQRADGVTPTPVISHAILVFNRGRTAGLADGDRKSTRLNSSHTVISYAVFCLKKKRISDRLALGKLADQPL